MNENFFSKFRIPTLLGLALIIFSTGAGVYTVLQGQNLNTQAVEENKPQNVIITNVGSDTATITWQTQNKTLASVTYKEKSSSQTKVAQDSKHLGNPSKLHYITLKNLTPKTPYQFRITSGKYVSENFLDFSTAPQSTTQNGYKPIIGTVIDQKGNPLEDGIVYLSIAGLIDQSALIGNLGNFVIPISQARLENELEVFQPEDGTEVNLRVISEDGQIASGKFELTKDLEPIGPLILGWDIGLNKGKIATTSAQLRFDLNNDGIINASDHAIVLNNYGPNPRDKRADLNGDGIVNGDDLQIILSQLDETGN